MNQQRKIFAVNTYTKKAVRLSSSIDWTKLAPSLDQMRDKNDFIRAMMITYPGPTADQLDAWNSKADQLDDIGFPFQITGMQNRPLEGSLNGVLVVGGLTRQDQGSVGKFLIDVM